MKGNPNEKKKTKNIYVYNPMVFIVLGSFCRTEGDFTLMCFNIKTVQCTFHSLFLVVVVVVFILFLPLLKYHTVYTFVASIFYYVRHHNFIFYCLRVWAPILCVRSFILLTLPLALVSAIRSFHHLFFLFVSLLKFSWIHVWNVTFTLSCLLSASHWFDKHSSNSDEHNEWKNVKKLSLNANRVHHHVDNAQWWLHG